MKLAMRVLSFCHYLQGPAATQYLADMGADVVKIEPIGGAFERHWSGGESWVDGVSAFMLSANRNKRSLAIDLKDPRSRPVMERLIDGADVVVENFRPGVLDRLGYGFRRPFRAAPAGHRLRLGDGAGAGRAGLPPARPGPADAGAFRPRRRDGIGGCRPDDRRRRGRRPARRRAPGHGRSRPPSCASFRPEEGTRVEASLFQAGIDLQAEALTKYWSPRGVGRRPDGGGARTSGSWYHHAPYGRYRLRDCAIVLSMNDPARLAEALRQRRFARASVDIDRYAERERYAAAVAQELLPARMERRRRRLRSPRRPG